MSKYSKYNEAISALRRKGLNSEVIARAIVSDVDPTLSTSGLARYIRRSGLMDEKPTDQQKDNLGILIFDIETAPMKAYTFQKWQTNIQDDFILQDWFILSWSAKWLFEDKVFSMVVTPEEALNADDKRIVQGLWKAMDDADIVVAHNLDKFDKKKANTRFLKHGLKSPSPYQSIDTLKHARRNFAITSNRLDYIAEKFLGIPGKIKNEKGLWLRCMNGEADALRDMNVYCDQDVRVLEDVYLELRPYMKSHPNVGLLVDSDTPVCTTCGSDDLTPNGEYVTMASVFQNYTCNSCGAHSRGRKSELSKKEKERLIVSNAR